MNLKISLDLDVTQERRCGSRMSSSNRFNNVHRELGSDDTFHLFLTNILYQTNLHRIEKFFHHHAAIVVSLPFVRNEFLSFFFSTWKEVMNLIGSSMYLLSPRDKGNCEVLVGKRYICNDFRRIKKEEEENWCFELK